LPAKATALQKSQAEPILTDFVLYSPPAPLSKRVASTVTDAPFSSAPGIPSLKKPDVIPLACSGLTGTDLRLCLDNLGVSSAPESEHVSQHDPQSLSIQVGQSIIDAIPDKSIQSLTSNVSKADRDAILARLTDFTNDDSAHATVDMAAFDPFDETDYSLSTVAISDNSSSDIDGDGALEPHSTMITEIVKPVAYNRNPSPTLDACISKYGVAIKDRYVVKLSTYVHLDYLKSQRQVIPPVQDGSSGNAIDMEASLTNYEATHNLRAINQALDANIIKAIYGSPAILPGSATEYTFMFQLAPDLISGDYKELLGQISSAEDAACQEVVEQHINPRTAIISGVSSVGSRLQKGTGNSLSVFYQVPAAFSRQLSAKLASALTGEAAALTADDEPIRDYCMVDGNGQKVAVVDPLNGAIIPACEKFDQKSMAKMALFTKSGACSNNKDDWAFYYPSRARTPRFGRGIQFILTEWLLHDQVGDYKNIHWYQSHWKSAFQVLVKGSKFVAATYFKVQLGAIKYPKQAEATIAVYMVNALFPLMGDILAKSTGMKIAGVAFSMPAYVVNFFLDMGAADAGNATFGDKVAAGAKGALIGFLVDRFTDAVAQMVDVEVTGWQDISDDSHHGCFQFD